MKWEVVRQWVAFSQYLLYAWINSGSQRGRTGFLLNKEKSNYAIEKEKWEDVHRSDRAGVQIGESIDQIPKE